METCDKCGARYNAADGHTEKWYAGKYIKTEFLGTQDNVSSYENTYTDVISLPIHLCPDCVKKNTYTESEIETINRDADVISRYGCFGSVIGTIIVLAIIIILVMPSIAPEPDSPPENIMYWIGCVSALIALGGLVLDGNRINWKPGQALPNKQPWDSHTRKLAEDKAKRLHRDKIFTPEEHANLKPKW